MVCQMLADRDLIVCDAGRSARSQPHTNDFLASARALCSVQGPADGHQQLGTAETVMKALAFPQTPVRQTYQALVTVAERPPDDMPESQLPADRPQLFL